MAVLASPSSGPAFEHLLAEAFRSAGWRVVLPASNRDSGDVLLSKGKNRYAAIVKAAPEGRRDRLVPLLAQAILENQSRASLGSSQGKPLAVVAAPNIAPAVAESLRKFASAHAPGIAVGVMDLNGLRAFSGPGLEALNSRPVASASRSAAEPSVDLFSDLNQWMLKVVLAPDLNRYELLSSGIPRSRFRNASELAEAARVSVMSAFRFLRQLDREGFLAEDRNVIGLVRLDELFRRWQASNLRPAREIAVRWILPGSRERLKALMKQLGDRACLGLFAAARACKLGHVHGVPAHVLVDRMPNNQWSQLGLIEANDGRVPDLVFRIPAAPESVFRGIVKADGFPASDVIQIWLDVSSHPARGSEQGQLIYKQVIGPMMKSAKVAVELHA